MRCDRCDNEATVHETRVVNGEKVEKHLCETCAQADGMAVGQSASELLMQKFVGPLTGTASPAIRACEGCGMTFAEFSNNRLLGCASCYQAFEAQFRLLLEREHEGATHHVGKVPRRALAHSRTSRGGTDLIGDEDDQTARIDALKEQLDAAVESEQYERAAKLRDEIERLTALLAGETEGDDP